MDYYRVSRTGGALLLAQMKENPENPVLAPVQNALHALNQACEQTGEETAGIERAVCKALTEQVTWGEERDPNGVRQVSLHYTATASPDASTANDDNIEAGSQNHLRIAIIARNAAAVRKFSLLRMSISKASTLGDLYIL
jgi:hypothetical protein